MFKRAYQKRSFAPLRRHFNKENHAECLRSTLLLKMKISHIKCEGLFELCPLFYTWSKCPGIMLRMVYAKFMKILGNLNCSLQIKC